MAKEVKKPKKEYLSNTDTDATSCLGAKPKVDLAKHAGSTACPQTPNITTSKLAQLLGRGLDKRRGMVTMQKTLEKAWQSAAKSSLALNRSFKGEDLPESQQKKTLLEAITKKRAIESLQQKAFLIFHTLTENKYEENITLGLKLQEKINGKGNGTELSQKKLERLAKDISCFLNKEDQANRSFLKSVKETKKRIDLLKKELNKTSRLPCQDKTLAKFLDTDLQLLNNFIDTTLDMLD